MTVWLPQVGTVNLSLTKSETVHISVSKPDLSSSPPGPYQQDGYIIKPEDKIKQPPFLPPHLLQVLLNKDTGVSVSPEQMLVPVHHM